MRAVKLSELKKLEIAEEKDRAPESAEVLINRHGKQEARFFGSAGCL